MYVEIKMKKKFLDLWAHVATCERFAIKIIKIYQKTSSN